VKNTEIFRPKSGFVASIFGYLLLFGAILQSIFTRNIQDLFWTTLVCTFIGIFIYCVIQRPRLEIADEGIKIINPISSRYLGWGEVTQIETRYALAFHTSSKILTSWAAVAPGRYHHRTIHPTEMRGIVSRDTTLIRASDSPRTDSGAAAYVARQRWEQFHRNHRS
jgi:hypothetical protein